MQRLFLLLFLLLLLHRRAVVFAAESAESVKSAGISCSERVLVVHGFGSLQAHELKLGLREMKPCKTSPLPEPSQHFCESSAKDSEQGWFRREIDYFFEKSVHWDKITPLYGCDNEGINSVIMGDYPSKCLGPK